MDRQLAEAWGQFLAGYPWDWFLTLTFGEPVCSFRAHRLFSRFARDIEKAAGVPIGWFRADELGSCSGRLHLHALMLNVGPLRRLTWLDEWNRRAGWARVLPFDPSKGAAYYCAKYVSKQFGDWDFSDNLTAFRQNQPVLAGVAGVGGRAKGTGTQSGTSAVTRPKRSGLQVAVQPPLADFLRKPDDGTQADPLRAVYLSEVNAFKKCRR